MIGFANKAHSLRNYTIKPYYKNNIMTYIVFIWRKLIINKHLDYISTNTLYIFIRNVYICSIRKPMIYKLNHSTIFYVIGTVPMWKPILMDVFLVDGANSNNLSNDIYYDRILGLMLFIWQSWVSNSRI